jgi:hypothetical protein
VTHPAGTIFTLRSGGFVGWTIRLLTRSRVNHAGICLGDAYTVEAQAAGAVRKVEHKVGSDVDFGVSLWVRIERLAPGRSQLIADEAEKLLGTPYNFADLLAVAWACRNDPTGSPVKPNGWQRRLMRDDRLICSQLVDLACLRARVHLFDDGRLPGAVTPGDIEVVLANGDWPIVIDA